MNRGSELLGFLTFCPSSGIINHTLDLIKGGGARGQSPISSKKYSAKRSYSDNSDIMS
jgi:hypothetical protein